MAKKIDSELDYKVTKIIYPRNNDANNIQFVIPNDPTAFCAMHTLRLVGTVSLPGVLTPDAAAFSKLVSQCRVEIASQQASLNLSR